MNDQSQIMGRSQILQPNQNYMVWPHRPPPFSPDNPVMFQNSHSYPPPLPNARTAAKPPGRVYWKGNKPDKRKEFRRNDPLGPVPTHGFKPSNQNDLQAQNRLKGRRFHPKKKFNNRFAPFAPRNTTSFLIRAKKSGGIASLVSPCPVTPAILPTPILSPSREVLGDMAKEEWGVDGYGSMNGLIRLRSGSPRGDEEDDTEDEEDSGGGGGGSSDSDVEEREEVEKRLDHDLSRFEMIYPNSIGGDEQSSTLENRVDAQDAHIAHLEEENLTLKERLFLMERELNELTKRVQCLENDSGRDRIGETQENASENNEDLAGDEAGRDRETQENASENNEDLAGDVCMKSVGNGDVDGVGDSCV
ncbi:hypothetical protein L6164_022951 [Bauhinia variegata]|uniref:Uncharacterized protein n=2 Tax=Bauhinia variegata TaxID=167791 RepID=A0ACB9MGR7_BAUVA|nr:hypothetical protein L6164_022951 [Bauhinia variegata]